MENSQAVQTKSPRQGPKPILTLGGRLSQGTTLTVLAVAGVGAGLVLGWDSLVALGLSSIVLALLPCAAMCALGLCASQMGKKDASAPTAPIPSKEAEPPVGEALANAEGSAAEKLKMPAPRAPAP